MPIVFSDPLYPADRQVVTIVEAVKIAVNNTNPIFTQLTTIPMSGKQIEKQTLIIGALLKTLADKALLTEVEIVRILAHHNLEYGKERKSD